MRGSGWAMTSCSRRRDGALERRAVEPDAVLERRLELGDGDREALEQAEHVDEPEADEPHAALLDRAQHELFPSGHAEDRMTTGAAVFSPPVEPHSPLCRSRNTPFINSCSAVHAGHVRIPRIQPMSARILHADDAFWRPSNQMGVLNTDLAKQLEATTLGRAPVAPDAGPGLDEAPPPDADRAVRRARGHRADADRRRGRSRSRRCRACSSSPTSCARSSTTRDARRAVARRRRRRPSSPTRSR